MLYYNYLTMVVGAVQLILFSLKTTLWTMPVKGAYV